MINIRYAKRSDRPFWYRLDRHLPEAGFEEKVRNRQGYVLEVDGRAAALLRYELFWDNTPFCTMLMVEEGSRGKGLGAMLMRRWEEEMGSQGYGMVLTSTRADETAQHFYRKLGYRDCGCLLIDIPGSAQPTELFFIKEIQAGGSGPG